MDFDLTPEEVAQHLTASGLEVESIEVFETVKGSLAGFVIGEVLTCEKHPDADRLSKTTVNIGETEPLNIICGAPNVAAGQKVVVATVGTTIYAKEEAFTIKKSKIRGLPSEGMICAEDELGLGTSHEGILVLEDSAPVGGLAKDYFRIETDYIFEIGLTPNRSDAMSHIGVATDLRAVLKRHNIEVSALKLPAVSAFTPLRDFEPVKILVKESTLCPRYTGVYIENIEIKESPQWLKNRLISIGIRPINNIVDITQYLMFELGQPLHAFDADKITSNKVVIQTLQPETKFTTLDGIERTLNGTELMICNDNEPMCMAGVFGGEKSGVSDTTTSVFLESAYFNPVSIRKTSKLHGLKTDASFRYERGCNPDITDYALKRAALLITELAGGKITSNIIDIYPKKIEQKDIKLTYDKLSKVAGQEIDKELVVDILKNLNIEIKAANEENLSLRIPYSRVDVTRPIDVIEEILRIYGLDYINLPDHFNYPVDFPQEDKTLKIKFIIGKLLSAHGFFEAMNNSLTKADYAESLNFIPQNETIHILNPLSKDLGILRQSLIPHALENTANNLNLKNERIQLFEFGTTYHLNRETTKEEDVTARFRHQARLLLTLCGKLHEGTWNQLQKDFDFYDLKNYVNLILRKLHISLEAIEENHHEGHVFVQGITYCIQEDVLVKMGQVAPKLAKTFDIKPSVFMAEFNMETLLKYAFAERLFFKELPKFPEVRRDLALVLDKNIAFSAVKKAAQKYGGKYLTKVNLFDVYEGDKIAQGKKSYALSFHFQNYDKTFTDEEIHKIIQKLIRGFETDLKAELRS